jgi:hypothetical protein
MILPLRPHDKLSLLRLGKQQLRASVNGAGRTRDDEGRTRTASGCLAQAYGELSTALFNMYAVTIAVFVLMSLFPLLCDSSFPHLPPPSPSARPPHPRRPVSLSILPRPTTLPLFLNFSLHPYVARSLAPPSSSDLIATVSQTDT